MGKPDLGATTPEEPAVDFHADIATRKTSLLQRLVAGVLHELNSPLAVLSSNAQLLDHVLEKCRSQIASTPGAESAEPPGPDDALSILSSIRASQKEACERVVETITSLKTCVGLDEAEWKLVDLPALLDSVVRLLRSSSRRGMSIERAYEGSTLIEGSVHQLSQLMMNLLLNSMEAAGTDGSVTVSIEESGDDVIMTFRDDGDGIQPEDLPKLFSPGFSTDEESAGLGLTICRYIVKTHQGILSIESEAANGTTVTVRLPKRHP